MMTLMTYLQYLAALVFVLALIGTAAFLARRLGYGRAGSAPGRRRRLAVVEVLALDAKRRLVLVRRDDVEHLVILGPANDVVLERSFAGPAEGFSAILQDQGADAARLEQHA